MATIIKLGTLCLDDTPIKPGAEYKPDAKISIAPGAEINWVAVNGLLIADRCLLAGIRWDDLDAQGLVFGKDITIGHQDFRIRLLKVGTQEDAPNEWDAALDVTGEENCLWNWASGFFWGQETTKNPSSRALRGYLSARDYSWTTSSDWSSDLGFRPALEPLPSDGLRPGSRACALGGQSILYGDIVDQTAYDVILRPTKKTALAEADKGELAIPLPNGDLAVDSPKAVIQAYPGEIHTEGDR
ncbi:hypothetical protein [uncultured Flavonifractor sp.]|uniref:hypothetical protein n=1 Tax=uncultured Flavonifractor sp. TaxID=1193534 RepID=UPI0025957CBC|nr:hypothetical protein [uncultured Flavonifractor sp.]